MNKKPLLIAALAAILIASCQKIIEHIKDHQHPSTGIASFTVVPDSSCFKPFEAPEAVALGEAVTNQQITLKVNVLKKGGWDYSTDTLNGYYFSASGDFASTGIQNITLNGHGTPVLPGNDRFTFSKLPLLQYQISVLDNNVVQENVPGDFLYFRGKIGEDEFVVYSYQTVDNVSFATSGASDTQDLAAFIQSYPASLPPAGSGVLSIQKRLLFVHDGGTEQHFKNFFAPGAYRFSDKECFPSGMVLSWFDDQGELWTTVHGAAEQSGSSFKIVGIGDGHDSKGRYYVKVFAKFNCKLYKLSSSETKDLTNGEMVICFKKSF